MGRMQAGVPTPEEISLLMDGELDAGRVDAVCSGLQHSECVASWVVYHVIGDTMRGSGAHPAGEGGARTFSPRFAARLANRLAEEPTVLAPPRKGTAGPAPRAVALALAATVAAVSVVGWVALTTMPAPTMAIASAKQAATVRATDARRAVDDEYLLAHQEYSPTTAIQGVRPFLRAVAVGESDARQ